MKKIVVILLLLAGATSFAQDAEESRKGKLKNMTSEQLATLRTKNATLVLDLNERQQKQIKALFIESAEILKSKMEAHKKKMGDDQEEPPTVDERFARENERLDFQIAKKEKLQKILSNKQMEKWEKMQRLGGYHENRKEHKKKSRK